MDLDLLEKSITPKTKAVIIVHLYGCSCDMDKLMKIIHKHNLILIEDCAQSHGARFKNKNLGTYGLISTFSFYPGKNLGAFGDGGSICTSDSTLYDLIKKIRNNGSVIKYHHEITGRNSRLDTIQSAILDIKLKYLDINNSKRRINADFYRKYLVDCQDVELPKIVEGCTPVYHLFVIKVNNRDKLKDFLHSKVVGVGIHYPITINKLGCYKDYFDEMYTCAEQNSNKILSLPMYPGLLESEIIYICDLIYKFFL